MTCVFCACMSSVFLSQARCDHTSGPVRIQPAAVDGGHGWQRAGTRLTLPPPHHHYLLPASVMAETKQNIRTVREQNRLGEQEQRYWQGARHTMLLERYGMSVCFSLMNPGQ